MLTPFGELNRLTVSLYELSLHQKARRNLKLSRFDLVRRSGGVDWPRGHSAQSYRL